MNPVVLLPVTGLPEFNQGDCVADLIYHSLKQNDYELQDGDVVVIAQKIISKAEGRYAYLDEVEPTPEAIELAKKADKDPRQVQLILDESNEVVRVRPGVVIVEHKLGYVHANAGIDKSNLPASERERVLLLPVDPDESATQVKSKLELLSGVKLRVIINDSAGRAWRNGTAGFAIGTAGFNPLVDMIGKQDRNGRPMEVTEVAVADELAAAASFLMGQAAEGVPAVIIRGANLESGDFPSNSLIRQKSMDMFR